MTTEQLYIDFKKKIESLYSAREADQIADWVFENVTGLKKWERRRNPNIDIIDIHSDQIQKHLIELLQHKPVQYVLQEAWFYKLKFFVNENVLVPRPETEELVEWVVSDVKHNLFEAQENKNIQIIDIGTGSGCIPVSLKKELPDSEITAIDISDKALGVAIKNAKEHHTAIHFLSVDFLNESEWEPLSQFDIVVSNPPYIPIKEKEMLSTHVAGFEPGIALFVKDDAPFIYYEKIAGFSIGHLKKNGTIYVEVHEEYANEVKTIFEKNGFPAKIKKDIYGKDRMVKAVRRSD